MEGSDNKNLKAYDYLAYYYDYLLMDEESLNFWLDYILEEDFKSCLELASGTGVMAGILKERGYEVIASDISASMKEASKANFDGEYLLLNMSDYKLDKKFDLILCICDSINYLNVDELDSFIKCAYNHLNDNGRLIFDMHHLKRLNEFSEEYIEEGYLEDMPYQWTINADDDCLHEHFTFYTSEGMMKEDHFQHLFKPEILIDKLERYFEVRYIEDFVPDEKVLFINRKKAL
ncbi:MAG: class I SAM-dependent DNA methyltransferase [Erysipelotrichaceae bacterium]